MSAQGMEREDEYGFYVIMQLRRTMDPIRKILKSKYQLQGSKELDKYSKDIRNMVTEIGKRDKDGNFGIMFSIVAKTKHIKKQQRLLQERGEQIMKKRKEKKQRWQEKTFVGKVHKKIFGPAKLKF